MSKPINKSKEAAAAASASLKVRAPKSCNPTAESSFYFQRISEKKLEAFTVGTFSKRQLSKKEIEEQKKKEDAAAAAHVSD